MITPTTNQTELHIAEYLVNLLPKPIKEVNDVVEMHYDIYGAPIEPLVKVSCEKELSTKRRIMHDLLTDHYDPSFYDVKQEHNNKYIKDVFTMISSLPKLDAISQTKPIESTFDEIPVRQTDSAEIKKFLRKLNVQFIGYYCDHTTVDEKCDKVVMNTSDLLESETFEEYKQFIERYVNCIYDVFVYYWYDNESHNAQRSEINELHVDYSTLMKMRLCINKLNTRIYTINSHSNKRCARCEAKQKLYDYTLREVERMRSEQEELDRQFDETDYDMAKFMQNNYPNIDRFLLKDVQQRYSKEFGQKLTFAQLTEKIEQTGRWKVTNVSRAYYVNRI